MLRSEVQGKTGLTRKAIDYYEEKGLIKPEKSANGYRNYKEKDASILMKIAQLRKIGLTIAEIETVIATGENSLSSILRKKQFYLKMDQRRVAILKQLVKGGQQNIVDEQIALLEIEETLYERLEQAFPGYFGQLLFSAYAPFLLETLAPEDVSAYDEFVDYLDSLPILTLSKEEELYLDTLSKPYDSEALNSIQSAKIAAVENVEQWWELNEETVKQYEEFKQSAEYVNSPMKSIQDKVNQFMRDNRYYEVAIPLIRKFSKSYDAYYKKLLAANDHYERLKS